jgi:hypothetical protein
MVLSDTSFKKDGLLLGATLCFAFYFGCKLSFDWFGIIIVFGFLWRYIAGYMNACDKLTIANNQLSFNYWFKKQWDFSVPIAEIKNLSVHYAISTWQGRLFGVNMNLITFEADNQKYQVVFSRGPKKLKILRDFLTENGVPVQPSKDSV